jgi:hypothetical protein
MTRALVLYHARVTRWLSFDGVNLSDWKKNAW